MTTGHGDSALAPLLTHVGRAPDGVATALALCATAGIVIAALTMLLAKPTYLGWLASTLAERDGWRAT